MKYPIITCTGIDERTNLIRLVELSNKYPFLEPAILYSANPEKRNRYPSVKTIHYVVNLLDGCCSVHICGMDALDSLFSDELFGGCVPHRLQINGPLDNRRLDFINDAFEIFDECQIITQYHSGQHGNIYHDTRHQMLLDGSGGNGILPHHWSAVPTKVKGFAGGLSPDNFAEHLPKIAEIGGDNWWCDMETGVRTDDWFDLNKVEQVCDIFAGHT